jgi:hypothetical protein
MKRSASFTLRCTSAPCENSLKLGILFKKTNVRVPHVRPTGRICSGIDTYSKIDTSGSSHYCTCTRTVRRYESTFVLPYESTKVLSKYFRTKVLSKVHSYFQSVQHVSVPSFVVLIYESTSKVQKD